MRSFLADWPIRIAAIAATIVALAVGVALAVLLPQRWFSLTDPTIGREWILGAALLYIAAILIRFGFPSLPYARMFGRSLIPFAAAVLKIVLLSAGITVLLLAAFNPVAGTRLYIYVDYNPNVGGDGRAALARNLIAQRENWLKGGGAESDLHYIPGDSASIREAVERLASAPDTTVLLEIDQLLQQFKDGLGATSSTPDFGTFILANLETSVEEIEASGRAGDRLVVLSTWRGAPQNWALDMHRFGSTWIQVAGESSGGETSPMSVQSYEIAHYPGLRPILSILVRAEAAIELLNPPPSVFLTNDGDEKCDNQTGTEIAVNLGGAPSAIGTLSTGRFEREQTQFVQIRIVLPASGPRFVCVNFPGAKGAQIQLRQPLFLGVRQLQLSASPELAAILRALVDTGFEPAGGELSISPLVSAKIAKTDGSATVSVLLDDNGNPSETGSFDIKLLPAVDRGSTPVLWDLAITPKTDPGVRLDVLDYVAETKTRLSGHQANYQDAPACGERSSIVTASPQGESGNCHDVLRMAGPRLELHLPPLEDITSLQDSQRRALRTTLVLAAAIAWSNGKGVSQAPVTREDYAVTSASTETIGWTPIDAPLWEQLVKALLGEADPRPASNAANSVRPILLSLGLLLIAAAAGIGLARPLMLSFSRIKQQESVT